MMHDRKAPTGAVVVRREYVTKYAESMPQVALQYVKNFLKKNGEEKDKRSWRTKVGLILRAITLRCSGIEQQYDYYGYKIERNQNS